VLRLLTLSINALRDDLGGAVRLADRTGVAPVVLDVAPAEELRGRPVAGGVGAVELGGTVRLLLAVDGVGRRRPVGVLVAADLVDDRVAVVGGTRCRRVGMDDATARTVMVVLVVVVPELTVVVVLLVLRPESSDMASTPSRTALSRHLSCSGPKDFALADDGHCQKCREIAFIRQICPYGSLGRISLLLLARAPGVRPSYGAPLPTHTRFDPLQKSTGDSDVRARLETQ